MRRLRAACPLFVCILTFCSAANAQRFSFRSYGQEKGLNNLAIECLLQDRAGYLWVGTQNGLFRYDGSEFAEFHVDDGLPSSAIDSLLETPDGVLWVGTHSGLARKVGARFEAVDTGAASAGRYSLASDPRGGIYVTTAAGLLRSSKPSAEGGPMHFVKVDGQPASPAYGLHVDPASESVWFGCGLHVCRTNPSGKVTIYDKAAGVAADRWDAIVTDRGGNTWIRSSRHLLRMAAGTNRFGPAGKRIPEISDFASLATGRQGELFVPTDAGMWELAGEEWRSTGVPQGLPSAAVSAVLQDREGSLWIGLWGSGLARYVGRNQWESWTKEEGLTGDHVWMMTRDRRGSLWVATDNGMNELRSSGSGAQKWRVWTEREGLASNKNRAVILGPDGAVWTGGSPGGISRIDPVTGRVKKFALPPGPGNDRIWSLAFDRSGTLWVCTRGGLFYGGPADGYAKFTRQTLPLGNDTETVSAALEDRSGRLWAAGMHGIARRENGVWRRFTKRDGLPTDAAGFLSEAPDGSIWVGYRDRTGLSRITTNGDRLLVQTFSRRAGLVSDQAIFVRVDRRGWVWFGTDRGVDVLQDGAWRHFGLPEGLLWEDLNTGSFFEDTDGSVWMGTSRGLAHFRPDAAAVPISPPNVEIKTFELGGKAFGIGRKVVVPWESRSLVAELAVLTFLSEESVLCRYRVKGLNDRWVETKNREIRIPALPAGTFVLEAVGRNASGEWSTAPARVEFQIVPPWWSNPRIRAGAAALILLCGYLWFRRRHRAAARQVVQLETAVTQRTRELAADRETIQQQKQEIERLLQTAQRSNLLKSEFLAHVSHEIRTPMNGIVGMTNLALATQMTPEQQEAITTVQSCAHSLLAILNDVLDFSKIEAGKLEIVPGPFRPADVVRHACAIFRGVAAEKSVRLACESPFGADDWYMGDAGRIRQVLLNLVSNAIKFTRQGEIRVSAERVGDDLWFAVRDSGIGIPEAVRSAIFEAFRQADGSTWNEHGGTGLGLAISTRLVELMGGDIRVDSEVGKGSLFRFRLPAIPASAPGCDVCDGAGKRVPALPDGSGADVPLRILVADDNAVNRRVAESLLRKRGHEVEVVDTGHAAVERSAESPFDVVLMDLQMPEMDGWEATRLIRARERRSGGRVAVIALTANAMTDIRERCLEVGMDSVVVKPFDPDALHRALQIAVRVGGAAHSGTLINVTGQR